MTHKSAHRLAVTANRGVHGDTLQAFMNADDGYISRVIAAQSELPIYSETTTAVQRSPSSIGGGTSMLHSGNNSLPALTRTETYSSSYSVSSSIGQRVLPMRILDQHPQQPLSVPPPPGLIIYECPFNFLHCLLTFGNFADWYTHSLTHFGYVGPPLVAECCFCESKFQNTNGRICWKSRMEHVDLHHKWGHRLSHARPAFGMIRYLWEKNIIDGPMYRELSGTPASRTQDSPTSSRSGPMRPTSPDEIGRGATVFTIDVNEGRRERARRRQERLTAAENRINRHNDFSQTERRGGTNGGSNTP